MSKKPRFHDVLVVDDEGEHKYRSMILGLFPPTFPNVYANYLTLAYGVGRHAPITKEEFVPVIVYGHYVGENADALFCKVIGHGDEYHQPKRHDEDRLRRFHITISLADGAKPGDVGLADPARIRTIAYIPLSLPPKRQPLWVQKPEVLPQARRA